MQVLIQSIQDSLFSRKWCRNFVLSPPDSYYAFVPKQLLSRCVFSRPLLVGFAAALARVPFTWHGVSPVLCVVGAPRAHTARQSELLLQYCPHTKGRRRRRRRRRRRQGHNALQSVNERAYIVQRLSHFPLTHPHCSDIPQMCYCRSRRLFCRNKCKSHHTV